MSAKQDAWLGLFTAAKELTSRSAEVLVALRHDLSCSLWSELRDSDGPPPSREPGCTCPQVEKKAELLGALGVLASAVERVEATR